MSALHRLSPLEIKMSKLDSLISEFPALKEEVGSLKNPANPHLRALRSSNNYISSMQSFHKRKVEHTEAIV